MPQCKVVISEEASELVEKIMASILVGFVHILCVCLSITCNLFPTPHHLRGSNYSQTFSLAASAAARHVSLCTHTCTHSLTYSLFRQSLVSKSVWLISIQCMSRMVTLKKSPSFSSNIHARVTPQLAIHPELGGEPLHGTVGRREGGREKTKKKIELDQKPCFGFPMYVSFEKQT